MIAFVCKAFILYTLFFLREQWARWCCGHSAEASQRASPELGWFSPVLTHHSSGGPQSGVHMAEMQRFQELRNPESLFSVFLVHPMKFKTSPVVSSSEKAKFIHVLARLSGIFPIYLSSIIFHKSRPHFFLGVLVIWKDFLSALRIVSLGLIQRFPTFSHFLGPLV